MNKLHVDISGSGLPLILLHGWGWHSGIWEPLLPQLREKYQIYLVDLPGFGNSQELDVPYTFDNIIPNLLKVAPEQAAWLGWSMGGLFAYWVAIHFPERVTHLITVASSPRFLRAENWPGVDNATLDKFGVLLKQDSKKTLLDFLELQLRGSRDQAELYSNLKKTFFSDDGNKPSLSGLLGGLELLRNTDLRNELGRIQCPSLHVFGKLDAIVPSKIAELLPMGKREVIQHTGHMAFLTHREIFLALLAEYLG